jgi:hypothetical protein
MRRGPVYAARASAPEPRRIVCDEPHRALDVGSARPDAFRTLRLSPYRARHTATRAKDPLRAVAAFGAGRATTRIRLRVFPNVGRAAIASAALPVTEMQQTPFAMQ